MSAESKRPPFKIAGIFLALLIIAGVYVYTDEDRRELHSLKTELKDFIVSNEELNSLTREDLRLAYYKTLHTIDPIFALAGADIETLKSYLIEVDASSEKVIAPYTTLEPQTIYPTELLRMLADTEQVRRTFLGEPTLKNATLYHESLASLLDEYEVSLQTLETKLGQEHSIAIFWQGMTDSIFVKEKISVVRFLVEDLISKEEARYGCLTGTHNCSELSEVRSGAISPYNLVESTLEMPPHILEHHSILTRALAGDRTQRNMTNTGVPLSEAPIIAMEDTYCSIDEEPIFYALTAHYTYAGDLIGGRVYDLIDFYFNDAHREKESGLFFKNEIVPEEFRYKAQDSNFYICIDNGTDLQKALSMEYIQTELQNNPLFRNKEALTSPYKEIAVFEERIVSHSPMIDTEMDRFMEALTTLYAEQGARGLQKIISKEEVDRLVTLVHVWQSRGAWFERVIGMMHFFMRAPVYTLPDGSIKFMDTALIISRGNIPSFYQLANPTVSSGNISLLKETLYGEDLQNQAFRITSYRNTLKEVFTTQDSMVEYLIESRDFFH